MDLLEYKGKQLFARHGIYEILVGFRQVQKLLAALHEIEGHLIVGSILASITVLLFMKSWRSTLIAAVAIPASLGGAVRMNAGAHDHELAEVTRTVDVFELDTGATRSIPAVA